MWFLTRSDTNQPVWSQKMDKGCELLDFRNLLMFVTAKQICAFVFAYVNYLFSHDAAHFHFV